MFLPKFCERFSEMSKTSWNYGSRDHSSVKHAFPFWSVCGGKTDVQKEQICRVFLKHFLQNYDFSVPGMYPWHWEHFEQISEVPTRQLFATSNKYVHQKNGIYVQQRIQKLSGVCSGWLVGGRSGGHKYKSIRPLVRLSFTKTFSFIIFYKDGWSSPCHPPPRIHYRCGIFVWLLKGTHQ